MIKSCLARLHHIAPSERGMYRIIQAGRKRIPADQRRGEFRVPPGYHMTLDLNVYPDCLMAFGLYELATARLIRRQLRPGDHFVDGGANIGYFTLLAAHCGAYVHAFEPMPDNRIRLIEHIERNQLTDRVTVHDCALTDQPGTLDIHEPGPHEQDNHGAASLFGSGKAIPIKTARLDDVLDPAIVAKISLVKLDIEGAEPLAVAGMAQLLGRDDPPLLIGELNPSAAAVAGTSTDAWVTRALAYQPRYQVYRVGWSLRKIEPTPQNLGTIGQTNLLLQIR